MQRAGSRRLISVGPRLGQVKRVAATARFTRTFTSQQVGAGDEARRQKTETNVYDYSEMPFPARCAKDEKGTIA